MAGGLNITNKGQRVANYHSETVIAVKEIIASAGYSHPRMLKRSDIFRRITPTQVSNYEEIFPSLKKKVDSERSGHEL